MINIRWNYNKSSYTLLCCASHDYKRVGSDPYIQVILFYM